MAKPQKFFRCSECGAQYAKWIGQCGQCHSWGTLDEKIVHKDGKTSVKPPAAKSGLRPLHTIKNTEQEKIETGDEGFNRILGGGIVSGSVILLGGNPGIGKSTLLLQIALCMNKNILYVSGEESAEQIKLRADRLEKSGDNLLLMTDTDIRLIKDEIESHEPDVVIIDSVQTLHHPDIDAPPGTVNQVKTSTAFLTDLAREHSTPIILVGHITKEGALAGPKLLEHMVDVVLRFEGEKQYQYRIIRSKKNRYGSVDEIAFYEMGSKGLKYISNPALFLSPQSRVKREGSAYTTVLQGRQAYLLEVQALVVSSTYSAPQRTSAGFDLRRLHLLLAVIERRMGFKLRMHDVFLNLAGGMKVYDPALDLAVVFAIVSNIAVIDTDPFSCFCGEVGLSGEIRPISHINLRITEASRLGMKKFYGPEQKLGSISPKINYIPINHISELPVEE